MDRFEKILQELHLNFQLYYMKHKTIWIVLVLAVGLAWYNQQCRRYFYPFLTTPSGLSYKAIGVGSGRKVEDGQWIELSLVMKHMQEEKDKQKNHKERILLNKSETFFCDLSNLFNRAIRKLLT